MLLWSVDSNSSLRLRTVEMYIQEVDVRYLDYVHTSLSKPTLRTVEMALSQSLESKRSQSVQYMRLLGASMLRLA